MRLIGWSQLNYAPSVAVAPHDCLVSMAGNAFSGFAAHPAFTVAFMMTGFRSMGTREPGGLPAESQEDMSEDTELASDPTYTDPSPSAPS